MRREVPILILLAINLSQATLRAATVSPLFARGYSVMPEPQQVSLKAADFAFGTDWRLDAAAGVPGDSTVVADLVSDLEQRNQIALRGTFPSAPTLRLEIAPGSVVPGPAQDRDRAAIASQAYRLELAPTRVKIVANAAPGLFYGVQTLLQLLKPVSGHWLLPEGEIVDWPDLQLRQIYWDDAHHLEYLSELKRAVRQAAFFKINGFVIKLEGHFQFRSAPALVEPEALSPAQFQELTDYGLRYHLQVIPYLDAPAHIAFILKHPEYAKLRAFPNSNYEMCVTNPDALGLMFGMYDDLLAANRGVKYFYLSTDEAYYIGLSNQNGCSEAQRARELGSVGKVLAEFVTKAAGYLRNRGRTAVFWGEYPLKPDDLAALPVNVINGETYGEQFDALYRAHGIRQMIYDATEGEERQFPHYFLASPDRRQHALDENEERIGATLSHVASDPARRNSDLMGLVIAGWGDMGLHPETFWLGYAAVTSSGWKAWSAGAREAISSFYPLFYGSPAAVNIDRIYQLMSYQAQIWMDTWDTVDTNARTPIWGNSQQIFHPPKPAQSQTLPIPAAASPDFRYDENWSRDHEALLREAQEAIPENDELQGLLGAALPAVTFNRYNLEVFLSIARLCRQNLELIVGLSRIDAALKQADALVKAGKAPEAIAAIDQALSEVRSIRSSRNAVLADITETWYKSWLPRVVEANGRRFLHVVDDVKDHLPDRTVDMSYLVYRELQLPFERWYQDTESARNQFAEAHHLPTRQIPLAWLDTH